MKPQAIIIGGGPAGLTAAYELLTRTDIHPIVIERFDYMGGISRTVQYKGNRMDIGGHRFFSKSDRVMNWWLEQLPQETPGQSEKEDDVMLVRGRKSRIYFLRKFFDYPIQLSKATLANLGPARTVRIGFSYLRAMLFPIRKVENLEQFFINRFGRELYLTFFKSYTEKVWGVPCNKISAEWGAQRIKGLSIRKAHCSFSEAIRQACRRHRAEGHRNLADRAVSLSQARAGTDVGEDCQAGSGDGRRGHHRLQRHIRGGERTGGWWP